MGTFSFCELNVYPPMCLDTYSMNECHFFITTIIMIRRNKMIEMSFKTLIIKVLVFILSNLLSSRRLEVDTQQLNVPKINVTFVVITVNRTLDYLYFSFVKIYFIIYLAFENLDCLI